VKAWQKIAAFALGLAVLFAVALGVGATVGPEGGAAPTHAGYTLERSAP
jgi:hypothetical protein